MEYSELLPDDIQGDPVPQATGPDEPFCSWFGRLTPGQHVRLGYVMGRLGISRPEYVFYTYCGGVVGADTGATRPGEEDREVCDF